MAVRGVDRGYLGQHAPSKVVDRSSLAVQEPIPEGSQHTYAAIGRSTATDTDPQPTSTPIECICNELSRAKRIGGERISLLRAHQRKSAGRSHLQHGTPTLIDQAIACPNRSHQRVANLRLDPFALQGLDQGLTGPFAPIGYRDFDHLTGRTPLPKTPLKGISHLPRRERPLEGVDCQDKFHRFNLIFYLKSLLFFLIQR